MKQELGTSQRIEAVPTQNQSIAFRLDSANTPHLRHLNELSENKLEIFLEELYQRIGVFCHSRSKLLVGSGLVNPSDVENAGFFTLAVCGPSGGGKSTLIEQLLRTFIDHSKDLKRMYDFKLNMRYISFSESALYAQRLGVVPRSAIPGHRPYTTGEYREISVLQRSLVEQYFSRALSSYENADNSVFLALIDPSTATRIPDMIDGNDRGYTALQWVARHQEIGDKVRVIVTLPDEEVVAAAKRERSQYRQLRAENLSAFLEHRRIVPQGLRNRALRHIDQSDVLPLLRTIGASPEGIARSHQEQDNLISDLGLSISDFYHKVLAACGVTSDHFIITHNRYRSELTSVPDDGTNPQQQPRHWKLAQTHSLVHELEPHLFEQLGIQ